MGYHKAQLPFWLLVLPCLWAYVMIVAADAFVGWLDFMALVVAEAVSVYSMAYWLAPKALANRSYGPWLLLAYIIGQAAVMLALLIAASFAVGGMRALPGESWWAALHADNLAQVSLLLVPGTAAGATLYLVRKVQWLQRAREVAQLEKAVRQLPPHTQLHLTASVRSVLSHSPELAMEAMGIQIGILKYYIRHADTPFIPLADEVVLAGRFIALNNLGNPAAALTTITVVGSDDVLVLPLLVYTLVENSHHHGDRAAPAGIRIEVSDHMIHIVAINKLRPGGGQADTTGTGLANLARRLQLHYPGRHRLTYDPQEGSFVVQIDIWR